VYCNATVESENTVVKRREMRQQHHPSRTQSNTKLALTSDIKQVCEQLSELDERKCQLAELECQLNKQVHQPVFLQYYMH